MESTPRVFGEHDRPDIGYPIEWTYKVVGSSEDRLRVAIASVVGPAEHTIRPSRTSRTGKYVSLELLVTVGGEAQRLAIGQALHEHVEVTFVL
jgi:putative lipoic acid-binding regulatory protein